MPKTYQHFITICIPIWLDPDWRAVREAELNDMIDALGNPVRKDIRDKLDRTGVIHFMSISVIPCETDDECSQVLIEAVADVPPKKAIPLIASSLENELYPVLRLARGIEKRTQISTVLYRYQVNLVRGFPVRAVNRAYGLPFNGVPGHSLNQIKKDKGVAEAAREAIANERARRKNEPPSAFVLLNAVREHLKAGPHKEELGSDAPPKKSVLDRIGSPAPRDAPPAFVDTADAPWIKNKKVRKPLGVISAIMLFPRSILAIVAVCWAIAFAVEGGWCWLRHFFYDLPRYYWEYCASDTDIVSFDGCLEGGFAKQLWRLAVDFGSFLVAILYSLWVGLLLLGLFALSLRGNLRKFEKNNTPIDADPNPAVVRQIMKRENCEEYVQNHMISVTDIQKGVLRKHIWTPLAARIVFAALKKKLFRAGFLANVGTVHFARWVMLPNTRKWVFLSNYDGSWESYLEDFITKSSMGVTAMWGGAEGFPKTRNIFWGGSEDGDRFKRFARRSMIPTRFWYSAYPQLTASEIRSNALINHGLKNITTATQADAWLELFGSIPRPDYAIETDEVQNLLFGAMKDLPDAKCIIVNFGEKSELRTCKHWVAEVSKMVRFGEKMPEDHAMYVAFSASGLAKLGLQDEVSTTDTFEADADPAASPRGVTKFPSAFSLGMHDASRARLLEDIGANASEEWRWGGAENSVDAIILLYADRKDPEQSIKKLVQRECKRIENHGMSVVDFVELTQLHNEAGEIIENFGFVDGVSQPKMRGYDVQSVAADPVHGVEPGEFILGYKDNRGYFPPTPQVLASKDPLNILPGPPDAIPMRWPKFQNDIPDEYATRDFGRNGSYLVIRQLQQHVDKFNDFTKKNAKVTGSYRGEEWVAAKVMGRWRNGSSIVRHPYKPDPDGVQDNDFLFAKDDPQGLKCPYGAHIRRANPRDSLDPESDKELSVSNRHRILRRGRTYRRKNKNGEDEVGLFFMCLNNDIERQFEFVQQNWIASRSFHGIVNEVDAVSSHAEGSGTFTFSEPTGPSHFTGLKSFVTVKGGGYFFLPSKRSLRFLAADRNG